MNVGIIDYGVGNIRSVYGSLEKLGVNPLIIDHPNNIHTADRLVLPGVGNFADCKNLLDLDGWSDAISKEVLISQKPLLGICLGMQLFASFGTEGKSPKIEQKTSGLNFIPGGVIHLKELSCTLRIPHVGWNSIQKIENRHPILTNIPNGSDFYFVHSYAFIPENPAHIIATADYSIPIPAVVAKGHIWGTQFHPEKSSHAGLRVLRNFCEAY